MPPSDWLAKWEARLAAREPQEQVGRDPRRPIKQIPEGPYAGFWTADHDLGRDDDRAQVYISAARNWNDAQETWRKTLPQRGPRARGGRRGS